MHYQNLTFDPVQMSSGKNKKSVRMLYQPVLHHS